jgi:hypothetical protein
MIGACTSYSPNQERAWIELSSTTARSTSIPLYWGNSTIPVTEEDLPAFLEIERDLQDAVGIAAQHEGHIVGATQRMARALAQLGLALDRDFGTPNIGIGHNDELVLEWWKGRRKLSLYVGPNRTDFIKIWGPDVDTEMADGMVDNGETLVGLFHWLAG